MGARAAAACVARRRWKLPRAKPSLARPLVTSCQPAESRRGVVPPSAVTTSARRHERARGSTQRLGRACGGGMRRPESVEAAARQAFARSPSRDVVPTCGVTTGRRATFGSHDVGTTSREGARLDSTAWARVRRHASPGVGVNARQPRGSPRSPSRDVVPTCAESRRGVVPPSAVTTSARRHERARGSTQRLGRACGGGMRRPESVEAAARQAFARSPSCTWRRCFGHRAHAGLKILYGTHCIWAARRRASS